jgi:hypothetical protein
MGRATRRWANDQQSVRGGVKHVLKALAEYAHDDTFECWPSAATIARDTGYTVNTVRTYIDRLEDLGLVQKVEQRHRPDGTYSTLLYRLNRSDPGLTGDDPPIRPRSRTGQTPIAPPVRPRSDAEKEVEPEFNNKRGTLVGNEHPDAADEVMRMIEVGFLTHVGTREEVRSPERLLAKMRPQIDALRPTVESWLERGARPYDCATAGLIRLTDHNPDATPPFPAPVPTCARCGGPDMGGNCPHCTAIPPPADLLRTPRWTTRRRSGRERHVDGWRRTAPTTPRVAPLPDRHDRRRGPQRAAACRPMVLRRR